MNVYEPTFFEVAEHSLRKSVAEYNNALPDGKKTLVVPPDGLKFVRNFCDTMEKVYGDFGCHFAFTVVIDRGEMSLVVKSELLYPLTEHYGEFVGRIRKCKRIEMTHVGDGVLKVRYVLNGCWVEKE